MQLPRNLFPLAFSVVLFLGVRACRPIRAKIPERRPILVARVIPPTPAPAPMPKPKPAASGHAGGVALGFRASQKAAQAFGCPRLMQREGAWLTAEGEPFRATRLTLGDAVYGLPMALERRLRDALAPHLPEGCLRAEIRLLPDGRAILVATAVEGQVIPRDIPLL